MNTGIYQWYNIIECKSYIGQSNDLDTRKKQFLTFHKGYSGTKIDNARAIFNSPDYWEYKVLEYCPSAMLDCLETLYMLKYDSILNGYNTTHPYMWLNLFNPNNTADDNLLRY